MQNDREFRTQGMDSDEIAALMSMALDGQLESMNDEQLAAFLAADPARAEEWQVWRQLDRHIRSAPAMEPPAGFVIEFERRLMREEKRRRLWAGFGVSAAVVLFWCLFVAGATGVSAYLLLWQANWLGETLRSMTYWLAVAASWAQSITAIASALLATPQAMAIGCAYVMASAGILWAWVRFLRRSVRGADILIAQ
jgi:anti-sigma factor RsiW